MRRWERGRDGGSEEWKESTERGKEKTVEIGKENCGEGWWKEGIDGEDS